MDVDISQPFSEIFHTIVELKNPAKSLRLNMAGVLRDTLKPVDDVMVVIAIALVTVTHSCFHKGFGCYPYPENAEKKRS